MTDFIPLTQKISYDIHIFGIPRASYRLLSLSYRVHIQITFYFHNQACHRGLRAKEVSQNNQEVFEIDHILKPDVEAGI